MIRWNSEQKEEFFEQIADTINDIPDTEELIVIGDFNGRVGKRISHLKTYLDLHRDTTTNCNYNGEQLLVICAA